MTRGQSSRTDRAALTEPNSVLALVYDILPPWRKVPESDARPECVTEPNSKHWFTTSSFSWLAQCRLRPQRWYHHLNLKHNSPNILVSDIHDFLLLQHERQVYPGSERVLRLHRGFSPAIAIKFNTAPNAGRDDYFTVRHWRSDWDARLRCWRLLGRLICSGTAAALVTDQSNHITWIRIIYAIPLALWYGLTMQHVVFQFVLSSQSCVIRHWLALPNLSVSAPSLTESVLAWFTFFFFFLNSERWHSSIAMQKKRFGV